MGTRSTSHTYTHTHTRGQPHLRNRGSCMHQAHTCRTAVPSLAVGSCTARCGDRRLRAGNLRESSGRLEEGEEGVSARGEHASSLPCPTPSPHQGTHGYSQGSRGSWGCTPGRWLPRSRDGSGTARLPHTAGPRSPRGHRHRLQRTWGHALGTCGGPPPCLEPHQSHPLTVALGIAVVAQATAVTVGAVELWPAQAAASVVTTLREGPHGAAATHCRPRVHRPLSRQPRPNPTPACRLKVPYSHWQRGKWK